MSKTFPPAVAADGAAIPERQPVTPATTTDAAGRGGNRLTRKTYSTRSNARRAAKKACRDALNAPRYEAFEGPDYEIGPDGRGIGHLGGDRYYFKLRGPALEAPQMKGLQS